MQLKNKLENIKNKLKHYKNKFRLFYSNKIKDKVKKVVYNQTTKEIRNKTFVVVVRILGMLIFALYLLFVLRLLGYNITWLNFISSFSLLMLIEEIPEWIKRCKK